MDPVLDRVAIVDSDRRRREAMAALLYIDLGIEAVVVGEVTALAGRLIGSSPKLLIIGWPQGIDGSEVEIGLARSLFPRASLIGLGATASSFSTADIWLRLPVDAKILIEEAARLLSRAA